MKKQTLLLCVLLVGTLVLMSGCAAGHNPAAHTVNEVGYIAGFWRGLWHGMIAPITFILSLFTDNVHFYEVHNNGGWYNFGFLLGISSSVGGSASSSTRSRK